MPTSTPSDPEPAGQPTGLARWVAITRAPFLSTTLVPLVVAVAALFATGQLQQASWGRFALAAIGALALHVAANTYNDLFDWRSGTDQANEDYIAPFSGGSRAIGKGLIDDAGLQRAARVALAIGLLCGLALILLGRPLVAVYGAVGALSGYFYTAPPLRLCARRGVGELVIGLDFGPLLVSGVHYAATGTLQLLPLLLGLPVGLLTAAILWVNEFPDARGDAATGKRTAVVALGPRRARVGFAALLVTAFALLVVLVLTRGLALTALAPLVLLPLAWVAVAVVWRHHASRRLIRGCRAMVALHALFGLLLALGLACG